MNLLIKNGRIIDPANNIDGIGYILVENGKIKAVNMGNYEGNMEATEVIDVEGKIVAPGFIDMHVHLREPGFEYKETIASGTRSAARGGFTSIACMPNTKPVIDDQTGIEFLKARAYMTGVVNVFPIGALTKKSEGKEISEIADLKAGGAVALSDDGQPVLSSEVMRHGMDYAQMYALPVISHSEDKSLVGEGVMNEGYYSTILGLKGIPNAAEEIMVAREILLAELTGCKLHVAHISTKGSVELIKMAKAKGLMVTAEATPHHFSLTDADVMGFDTATKVNPPLRNEEDRQAVLEGLKTNVIDVIATDHAPHADEEKNVEYNYAPNGMVGLETAVGLMWTKLVAEGVISESQAIEKVTINPARVLGIDKGTLSIGKDADITIIDPSYQEEIRAEEFESKGKNSPFIGKVLNGMPVYTIVNGKIIMKNRKVLA